MIHFILGVLQTLNKIIAFKRKAQYLLRGTGLLYPNFRKVSKQF